MFVGRFQTAQKSPKQPCVAFSLAVQLETMPWLATKPYWGFDENMDMVLVEPSNLEPGSDDEMSSGTKRKGGDDDYDEDVEERFGKRVRV